MTATRTLAGVVPPSNLQAEESALGGILVNNTNIPEVRAIVAPDDFYKPAHAIIFDAVLAVHDAGAPADSTTVADELKRRGLLDTIGGPAALTALVVGAPHSDNAAHYAQIVARYAQHRRLQALGHELVDAGQEGDLTRAATLLEQAEHLVHASVGGSPKIQDLVRRFLTVDEVCALPPPDWIVDGILAEKALAVLWGKPGSCKSFVALDWSMSIATGSWWFGRQVAKGNVLYVAAEGAAGLGQRMDAWKADRSVYAVDNLRVLPSTVNLLDREWSDAFVEAAKTIRPSLIVADTLARVMVGGDENTARDMGVVVDTANRAQEATGAAVLLIHHDTKEGSTMRGSSALLGAVDTSIECKADGQDVTLKADKQKDAAPFQPVRLWLQPRGDSCVLWARDRVAATIASTNGEKQLLEAAGSSCGSDGLPASALLKISGLTERTFYRALKTLTSEGLLVNVGTDKAKRYTTPEEANA